MIHFKLFLSVLEVNDEIYEPLRTQTHDYWCEVLNIFECSDNLTRYEHNSTLRKALRIRLLRHSGYESLTQDSQTCHPIL